MKLLKNITIASLFLTLLVVQSCSVIKKKQVPFEGSGMMGEKEFRVGEYDVIILDENHDLYYEQKENVAPFVRIETDENLITFIKIELKKGELKFGSSEPIHPTKYRIYTNSRNLKAIRSSGNGEIHIEKALQTKDMDIHISGSSRLFVNDLKCRNLNFKITGIASAELKGRVTSTAKYNISGNGQVKAKNLLAERTSIQISGSGLMEVYVRKLLDVKVSGSGDVQYFGSPEKVNHKISGIGKVHPASKEAE